MPPGSLAVTIEGYDLPGRAAAPPGTAERYQGVHVGVQRRTEVIEQVPGDADGAEWTFTVTTKVADDGTVDVGGPYVHGKRGDRFFYLSWGVVDGESFTMFRRAKLNLADVPPEVLQAGLSSGRLRCRVRLTDASGAPRCARVRVPDAVWTPG